MFSRAIRLYPWSLSLRFNSTVARPFNFHIGVSWAPKPPDPEVTRFHTAFSADSQLGKWRDAMLAHPKRSLPKDAGEDFFYHTEARPLGTILLRISLTFPQMRNGSVGKPTFVPPPQLTCSVLITRVSRLVSLTVLEDGLIQVSTLHYSLKP